MPRTPVPEAKLVETEGGLKPEGDGWFIVNVADTMSLAVDDSNYGFVFEEAPGGPLSVAAMTPSQTGTTVDSADAALQDGQTWLASQPTCEGAAIRAPAGSTRAPRA